MSPSVARTSKHPVADFQNGNIERSAAQVIDGNFLVGLLIQTVSQRGSGRLVDDPAHFQARDFARRFGGISLGVVEISGHGDHRFGDFRPQLGLGVRLELAENHRGNFLRGVAFLLATDFDFDVGVAIGSLDDFIGKVFIRIGQLGKFPADQAFGGENGVPGVGYRLTFCRLADQSLAIFRESDYRRGGPGALGIFEDNGFAAFHDGHAGVGGT